MKHLFLSIWCRICKPKIFTQSCQTKPLMHAECWLWTCLHSKYEAVDLPAGISKNIIYPCLILTVKTALAHRVMLPLDPWHQHVGRSSKSRKIHPRNRGVCLTHRFVMWGVLKAKLTLQMCCCALTTKSFLLCARCIILLKEANMKTLSWRLCTQPVKKLSAVVGWYVLNNRTIFS